MSRMGMDYGDAPKGPLGDRLTDAPMADVPSDVMKNPKLRARAGRVAKGKTRGRLNFKEAGDILAASTIPK